MTHAPVPEKVIQGGGDATETTLTILEIIKEKKRKENRAKKVLLCYSLHLKNEKIVDQRVLNKQNRMRENYDIFLGRDDSTDGNGAKNEERKKAEGHLVVNNYQLENHFFKYSNKSAF